MIYIRCPHCGRRIPAGEKCSCGFKRDYADVTDRVKKQYHSARWTKTAKLVTSIFNGLDPYALKHGSLEYAEVVHHIVPTDEDSTRFFDTTNLIPLSKASHREVHRLYEVDEETKVHLQDELRSIVREREEARGM